MMLTVIYILDKATQSVIIDLSETFTNNDYLFLGSSVLWHCQFDDKRGIWHVTISVSVFCEGTLAFLLSRTTLAISPVFCHFAWLAVFRHLSLSSFAIFFSNWTNPNLMCYRLKKYWTKWNSVVTLRLASAEPTLTYLTSFNVMLATFFKHWVAFMKLMMLLLLKAAMTETKSHGSNDAEIINNNNLNKGLWQF